VFLYRLETLMSKGPGSVMRKIDQLFRGDPEAVFSTADLCAHVYGLDLYSLSFQFPKKQRVAVIRAARAVAKNHPAIHALKSKHRGASWFWFHLNNPKSCAIAHSHTSTSPGPQTNPPPRTRNPFHDLPQPKKESLPSLSVLHALFVPH
jgi:hypothetical protein